MAAKRAEKRKPGKAAKTRLAKQAKADINALVKTQKKLDLELRKLKKHVRTLLGHQYKA